MISYSARSEPVPDTMDPKFDKDFTFEVPGDPSWFMQLILIDDNTPLPERPLGQAVIPLHELGAAAPLSMGGKLVEHRLKFSKLPGVDMPPDTKKSKLTVEIGYDIVMDA